MAKIKSYIHISHDGQIAGSQKRNLTVFAFALEQIL